MVVASHQLVAAFRHKNTSALQGCLEPTEVVPYPYIKTQKVTKRTTELIQPNNLSKKPGPLYSAKVCILRLSIYYMDVYRL